MIYTRESIMEQIFSHILSIWFIWLPLFLWPILTWAYLGYKENSFIANKFKYKILEINIPKDVHKSPEAMEMVIDILNHLGGGAMSWKIHWWQGAVFFPSSLEIVSIEGSIYFFIRAHVQVADSVKSTIYSQFPNAEVHEVDDYTKYVPNYNLHQDTWDLYGVDFKLAKDECIPIKTYVDYGLDKSIGTLEEEQKIDPITPMLEFFGGLGPGEQVWIQYIVRTDFLSTWRKDAKKFIDELMKRGKGTIDDDFSETVNLTHGEQNQVKAVERSLSKVAFQTVIRAVYIAPKENFNKSVVGFFKNPIFKPFSSSYFNAIWRNSDTDYVDFIWQDITGKRTPSLKRRFFNDYVNREAFYESRSRYLNFLWYSFNKPFIMTSEELATLFHIPGRVSTTTSLERIDAKKAEPPQNLPI